MKILVWQWGRRGAGPRFAACMAEALRGRPGMHVSLSLSRDAEIMACTNPPRCDLPVRTYTGLCGFVLRAVTAPLALPALWHRLRAIRPDLAICAMPGPLDLMMAAALKLLGSRIVVVVHDATAHPGDGFPGQMRLQRWLCRWVDGLAYLCARVGNQLVGVGAVPGKLIAFRHPPFGFDVTEQPRPPGPPRLLCFGRLLPYKGLDLLGEALGTLGAAIDVRIVGAGAESPALDALRAIPGVTVENRWVPETEIGALLGWSDALILPYREASQSGVAAAALAAGRTVIATRVGGLREQLASAPQAVMCEPDAASLARAIMLWLESPPAVMTRDDPAEAWRVAVSDLLAGIAAAIPAQPAPLPGAVPHGVLIGRQ